MKYVFYRVSDVPRDRLICKRVDQNGNVTQIQDAILLQNIIDRFIQNDYKIVIKGNNLYLYGKNTSFVLRRFPEVIDCKYLKTLKQSILTKMPEDKLVPNEVNNKKGFKSALENLIATKGKEILLTSGTIAACTISLVTLLTNNNSLANTGSYVDEPSEEPYTISQNVGTAPSADDNIEDDNLQIKIKLPKFYKCDIYSVVEEKSLSDTSKLLVDNNPTSPTETYIESTQQQEPEITFEEKELAIRQRYYLTKEMTSKLLISMCDNTMPDICFASSEEALYYLYETEERTYPEKMLIVMAREGLTYEQLDDICAGVRAEGGEAYEECCRVASVGYNRYRSKDFTRCYGKGLYTQFLAPSQFSVFYGDKTYLEFKGNIESVGYQAAIDTFFSRNIVTDYLSFRGWWVTVPDNWETFMYRGNHYGNHQDPSDVLTLDYEILYAEEMATDLEEANVNQIER